MPQPTPLLDAAAMRQVLERMATEIVNQVADGRLVLVGIQRRGTELADRLAPLIEQATGAPPARGALDITLYRDDLSTIGPSPVVHETRLPDSIDDATVVIVDDVLYTGRTIRAALDEIADFGRPRRIMLAVLVERDGRELPIAADIAGVKLATGESDHVMVRVSEVDGDDRVDVQRGGAG